MLPLNTAKGWRGCFFNIIDNRLVAEDHSYHNNNIDIPIEVEKTIISLLR